MPCPSGWGFYILIMKKIKLLVNSTTLGDKGDIVDVGINLAIGLIGKNQAIWSKGKQSLPEKTVKELQDIAKEKGISYSGLKKSELLKELKEADTTKELKDNYETK